MLVSAPHFEYLSVFFFSERPSNHQGHLDGLAARAPHPEAPHRRPTRHRLGQESREAVRRHLLRRQRRRKVDQSCQNLLLVSNVSV